MTVSRSAIAPPNQSGLLRAQPMLLITLAATAALLTARPVSSVGPSAGQNRQTFGFLCGLVLAAELDNQKIEPSNAAMAAATNAAHISTILAQPDAIAKLQAVINKTPSGPSGDDQLPDSCKGDKAEACRQAARYLASLPDAERQKVIHAATDGRGFKQKINDTVNAIKKLDLPGRGLASTPQTIDVAAKLRLAVYGTEGPIPKKPTIAAQTNRQTTCGNADTAAGAAASKTVVATIACLCASDSSSGATNTGCYETSTGAQAFDGTANEIQDWHKILTECKAVHPNYQKLGYTQLPSVLSALRAELYAAKGSGEDKIGILGAIQGTGSGACDGEHGSNKGACASFRSGANKVTLPTWLTGLTDAMAEVEQQKAQTKNAIIAEAQVHALNETLTTLLNLNAMEALKQPTQSPTQAAQTPSGDSKKQQEEAEEKCKKLDKKTDCNQHKNPKCKWTKPDVETGNHCELNETKAEKQATQTGGNAGTTTAVKCSDYGSKDKCEEVNKGKDKPVCGWRIGKEGEDDKDTEKCRNGSFLVNNKFALSVVSAAFVTLLF
uniref:Variant surface glycoprotein n=1 Tax=Trypanosoma brucei TaxID=5691 RepID=S5G6K6_9TRYP|nr:variant surface glycoprotein [Trypanosoma brucei]